jgi:hypothetical protein
MTKQHFQTMFNAAEGCVYKFVGTIPQDKIPSTFITKLFFQAAETDNISTVVVNDGTNMLLYTSLNTPISSSANFELLETLAEVQ